MGQTLKGLLASAEQALKLESQKKFLHRYNSYLQNNQSIYVRQHVHEIRAKKKKAQDHFENTVFKIKVTEPRRGHPWAG